MKKSIALLIMLAMLFLVGCTDKTVNDASTTKESSYLTTAESNANSTENAREESHSTKTATSVEHKTETVEQTKPTVHNDDLSDEPPPVVYFTLESFAEFKQAYNTMSEKEFTEFLYTHGDHYEDIESREKAKEIIEITENTTVPLLDGNKENFYKIAVYLESYDLFQPIIFSETRNVGCTYYNSKTKPQAIRSFKNDGDEAFVKEVVSNGVTAKVYYEYNQYFIEFEVDETQVFGRFIETDNVEQIEADFARLSFAKIGDLI